MKRPNVPCLGCQDRFVTEDKTCHATCDRYKEYCQLNELYKASVATNSPNYSLPKWYRTCTGYWRKK